jgi:hypothetical protein
MTLKSLKKEVYLYKNLNIKSLFMLSFFVVSFRKNKKYLMKIRNVLLSGYAVSALKSKIENVTNVKVKLVVNIITFF